MSDLGTIRRWVVTASVLGATAVFLGAFGAHGLEGVLAARGYTDEHVAKRLSQFDVGVRYHLIHAVALLALAALPCGSASARRWTSRLLLAGVLLFSGSLYLLVMTDTGKFGMVTPLGGLCLILGWCSLARLGISDTGGGTDEDNV